MNGSAAKGEKRHLAMVMVASSSGTTFEWYDFFVFGLLAPIMAKQFFAGVNETAAFIFTWLTFAAGLAARPFGGVIIGHIGDRLGRKYAFLLTIVLMGVATFTIGLLPTYAQAGVIAPIVLVLLRLCQGFAVGGEYGGAAIYLAEHAPAAKRGLFTSAVQIAGPLGLIIALIVMLATREAVGDAAMAEWAWRIPYLLSLVLLVISVWIRLHLQESPLFQKIHKQGALSKAPLKETLSEWRHLRLVIITFWGICAAQGVTWYTYHFYAPSFLDRILHVDPSITNTLLLYAVICSLPIYVFFAWLSDRIGRKNLMAGAIALATLLLFPLFHLLAEAANPALVAAQRSAPIAAVADPETCSVQFDPVGTGKFVSSCDILKSTLAGLGVSYTNRSASPGTLAAANIGSARVESIEGAGLSPADLTTAKSDFAARLKTALKEAGYPEKADPAQIDRWAVFAILMAFVSLAAMLFGPMAAAMVELFPTRIRYTALSTPYHAAIGWLGGFMPAISFAMVTANGNVYYGLWYPVVISGIAALVTFFFLPETHKEDISR